MNTTRLIPILLALGTAQAQTPANLTTSPLAATSPRSLITDQPGDGSIWALGTRYKAGFDAQGTSFIPALGSQYPAAGESSIMLRNAGLGSPIPAGAKRIYQVYYRDPGAVGCSATFNTTNAVQAQY